MNELSVEVGNFFLTDFALLFYIYIFFIFFLALVQKCQAVYMTRPSSFLCSCCNGIVASSERLLPGQLICGSLQWGQMFFVLPLPQSQLS
uniref:Hypothetical secreted protein 664 n=1 Tax=Amblyomma variegatum TaxID=34610 RepID=F0JA69_AMBVA|nr:TPA_inf: hypothetical secreted protein 664 [Amblyomma variegatum]